MKIRSVDPRDESWGDYRPPYRVYFWRRSTTSVDRPDAEAGYDSEEFEVTAADVEEVLAWASSTAGAGRTYTVYVLRQDRDGLGLIRLSCEDPTRSP